MKDIIKEIKNYKIVPDNFKSSTIFSIDSFCEDNFICDLRVIDEVDMNDYKTGDEVEVFGLGNDGIIYFVTRIVKKNANKLTLQYPKDTKKIQRREYPRVNFDGQIIFKDIKETIKPLDVSAGGIRFLSGYNFEIGKNYFCNIKIKDNIEFECFLEVLNMNKKDKDEKEFRCKFNGLDSKNRIEVIQYTFEILMKVQNKQG